MKTDYLSCYCVCQLVSVLCGYYYFFVVPGDLCDDFCMSSRQEDHGS